MKRYHIYYFEKSTLDWFCEEYNIVDESPFDKTSLAPYLFKCGKLIKTTDKESEVYTTIEQMTLPIGDICIAYDIEDDIWFEL